jgi:dipeptidyl aminopeptidase/acylaminoacyl peptidase
VGTFPRRISLRIARTCELPFHLLVNITHSFGGAVSLSLAEELPSIQSVVSIAAPSNTFHLAALLERKNPKIIQDGRGEVQIGTTRHIIDRQMIDNFRSIQLNVLLGRLSKPVFLMHSPSDETLGFEHALQLYQMLSIRGDGEPCSCPTSLLCLEGADHLLVNNSHDLELISRMIAAWFDRQLAI